jgi:hypothetical protein
MQIEIEGRQLPTELACLPGSIWALSAECERARHDRFNIVLRFPELRSEYGIELKQISFVPMGRASASAPEKAA